MFNKKILQRSFLFGIASCLLVGCAPENLKDVAIPIPAATDDIASSQTNTIHAKSASADSISPASSEFKLPDPNAEPEVVCRKFLELLNQDDSAKFELLLTPAALNVSSKLKFQLPPIADSESSYSVNKPVFGSIREKLCFVDAELSGSNHDADSTITMMLRKTKSGWRVAGMMVDSESSDVKNLLSFENVDDVSQIKSSVEIVSIGADGH